MRNDEFGSPSSAVPWVPVPMVRAALDATELNGDGIQVTHTSVAEESPDLSAAVIIDLSKLPNLR